MHARTWTRLAGLGLGVILAAGMWSCRQTADRGDRWVGPAVVRIDSEIGCTRLFPGMMTGNGLAAAADVGGLLLRDGDSLLVDEWLLVHRTGDGGRLAFAKSEGGLLLRSGGTVVGAVIGGEGKGNEGLKWIEGASPAQLAALRCLVVGDTIDARVEAAARRVAAANPGVTLGLEATADAAAARVLAGFSPRAAFVDWKKPAPEFVAALARQTRLETLILTEMKEGGRLDFLTAMAGLRRLALFDWQPATSGPLPAGLPPLREFLAFGGDFGRDLAPLAALPASLEELSLLECGVADFAGLTRWPQLQLLAVMSDEQPANLSLGDAALLPRLRWLGLPAKTTQEQFAAAAAAHPRLQVLEFYGNENPLDLAPLLGLRELQGLVIGKEAGNLSVLGEVRSLRYVGLPKEVFEKSPDKVAAIRKALPDALVVPAQPFCLGSGWILLLAPLVLGLRAWRSRTRRTHG